MAADSVNPFNLSDSENEAEQRAEDGVDTERSLSDGAPGLPSNNPFSPQADAEPPALLLSSTRTSPSVEGISVAAAAMPSSLAETRVSVDVIAAQLIRDQYFLTALEFHTELLESGRELPRLRDYFSNPGNFERQSGTPPACKDQGLGPGGPLNRVGSISTLDSLDFARYSDDGNRESDERVAVLEFELRKAKETIQALRANLTQAAESDTRERNKNYKSNPEIQEPIRPLEKRALHFLVNEYLLKNEYKLSAITFSDENDDQDFELWDDVGLNIPKPPDLLQIYRNCGSALPSPRDTVDVSVGVEAGELTGNYIVQKPDLLQQQHTEMVEEFEYQISLLNEEKQSLAYQIKKLQSEIQSLRRTVSPTLPDQGSHLNSLSSSSTPLDNGQYLDIRRASEPDKPHTESNPPTQTISSPTHTSTQPHAKLKCRGTVVFDQPNRKLSPAFQQALLSFCKMSADSRLGAEVSRIADNEESVMLMLGRCLPHIVPNVLLAKREELIPLILCTACLHPEPKERDQLLHILFNLIKRPDDEQRRMILTGCVAFARHVGPTRVEAELLPQCWEQINHKYSERRLLVAEACGALAPYLPKEMRSSLVLSMLQQMLAEDKADMVREAVVKSLAIIMGYIDDPDKYSQGFELMLLSLGDPSERVVSAIHQVFIPAFAAWTTELGILQTTLIPSLLARIEKLLKQGEHGLDEHKLHMFLSALQSLIPPLFSVVLQNAPFTHRLTLQGDIPPIEVTRFPRPASPLQDVATVVGSREMLSGLLILYVYQLEHEGTTGWDSLLWVVNQLLPQLIEIVGGISVTSTTCVHEFSRFFWRLCRTFGKIFTNTKVKPQFQEILLLSEENVDALTGNAILTKATVPVYASGVLTCYNQDEDRKLLVGFLEDVMTTLSLSHAPLDSLKASFIELGANPVYHDMLLTVLWYGVVHTSSLHLSLRANPVYHDMLLTVLWYGVVHTSSLHLSLRANPVYHDMLLTVLWYGVVHTSSLHLSLRANPVYHDMLLTVLWYGVVHTSSLHLSLRANPVYHDMLLTVLWYGVVHTSSLHLSLRANPVYHDMLLTVLWYGVVHTSSLHLSLRANPVYHDMLLTVLWYGVVHTSSLHLSLRANPVYHDMLPTVLWYGVVHTSSLHLSLRANPVYHDMLLTVLWYGVVHTSSLHLSLRANPVYHDMLLTVLWYGVVHTSALVRCTAACMFELLVKGVNETLVAQRVVPALITLSSDPEMSVRISTIPAFGTIMEMVTHKELLERVKMQLASFLEDPQYQDQHSLHMEIIRTFGRVGPNTEPRFRDEFVLPHLHKLALDNNAQNTERKRMDIATQLFEAYSALSCCFISEELMVNHFLPGLRCLRADMEQLSPEHEVILSSMIKEGETKVENRGIGQAEGSVSIAASLVGEDAKTKFLSKMGQLTTSGAMLANVFQRKK
ncbi:RAB11-binding protein RELCH homolog isoform X4 [Oncorhynchus kisutch]|uniref:RAB11-binding protein RELCH homolog isoform X4 n=1 Tax=Oncorhynchus kisutch TaxID=8019 RepID=UPI0012DCEE0F|nr:RAB11-binding protein RELCH homolog isoform X4 [Oncorhynchus kisutch]